jgi:tetratricopeptide (TPR) repeat protein
MKHKQLGITKIMATWSILTVAAIAIIPIMGVSSAMKIPQYLQQMSGSGDIKFSNQKTSQETPKIKMAKKNKNLKPTQNSPMQNVDWGQKALALWQGDKYKNPNKAVDYWNHAVSSKQNTAVAYSNRGLAYHDLRQYQNAVKDFDTAIKMDPGYAAAYNNRGNSYYELNEYKLALDDFNQSLKLKPKNAKARLNRGLAFYQMDKNVQACKDFQKSCDRGDCDGIKWAMKNRICK